MKVNIYIYIYIFKFRVVLWYPLFISGTYPHFDPNNKMIRVKCMSLKSYQLPLFSHYSYIYIYTKSDTNLI